MSRQSWHGKAQGRAEGSETSSHKEPGEMLGGAQPLLPHGKSQFSSVSPFTQSLFVHPLRLPSPRQTRYCLVKGQLIFWAAGGGEEDNDSSGDPATLKCHQAVCETARAGQRGLLLPTGKEGDPAVLDAVTLPLPSRYYRCSLGLLVFHGSQRSGLIVNPKQMAIPGHTNSPRHSALRP